MSNIFIGLYLDEDVNVIIADILQGRGYTALTTRDAGMLQKQDAEQLAYAVSLQKTILTHNRNDFQKLSQDYFLAGQNHYGIIIARRHPLYVLVNKLLPILDQLTADEMINQLVYV
jgi:predicted nuclease of predicted toxin-antitoxin system